MRIAIVGSGVAGMVCAHVLRADHDVTLFEAEDHAGGHAHTITVDLDGAQHRIDTGFMVYNEANYPHLTRLLALTSVNTRPSDMSFAVCDDPSDLEWCGSSLRSVFAQGRNVLRPAFWAMLRDVVRFNRRARQFLAEPENLGFTLGDFVAQERYSPGFVSWYLVPMGAAIWSADPEKFLDIPAAAFLRFFDNHGLLGLRERPQWRTVVGGSITYVNALVAPLGDALRLSTPVLGIDRLASGVQVRIQEGAEVFDHVILACHSDQSLALLASPTPDERDVLSAIRYRENTALVHTDSRVMPRREAARASWNWRRRPDVAAPTLTYDLSRLQGLDTKRPLYLTLNQDDAVDQDQVLARLRFTHPVYDFAAMVAQQRHGEISGRDRVSFAGAYWGYGFHEDGVRSALRVCHSLGVGVSEALS